MIRSKVIESLKFVASIFPSVHPHLSPRAKWLIAAPIEYKTYDYFLSTVQNLVRSVYTGTIGGEFIDIMASLIQGQLRQAFLQAMDEEELHGDMPDYLMAEYERMVLSEYEHVDQFFRDIVDAHVDDEPIDSLLARAVLWANRYTDAYEQARHLITMEMGGNEEWVLGATEQHCETCGALHGIVARASEWDQLGVHPQQPPNAVLECGGWHCDCERRPTEKRRSPKAFESILNAVNK